MSAYEEGADGDTFLRGGQIAVVSGIDAVVQSCKTRLKLYLGEWFLDLDAGTGWYQRILTKPVSAGSVDAELKRVILGTPGVVKMLDFGSVFDRKLRVFFVRFTVLADDGSTGSEVVTIG